MARETVGLKIDIDSRSAATAARRMDALGAAGGRVGRGLKTAGVAFAAIGIAATAAAGAILRMTTRIAEQADEIGKTSRGLGITTDAYQDLSHALELSGSSIEGASGGFRRLSANMLDAQQGVTTAADAFGDLGVEVLTAGGDLRSFDAVLGDIADEFAAMPDGAEKTARSMELFGRSGAALIPMLDAGSSGIAEMRQEAHDLGLVLSNDLIISAEALNDDLTRLRGSLRGVANGLATELIPRIRDVVGDIQNFTDGLDESNVNLNALATDGAEALITGLRFVAAATLRTAQGLLFLRRQTLLARNELVEWFGSLEAVGSRLPIPHMRLMAAAIRRMGLEAVDVTETITGIDETVADLELLHGHILRIGIPTGPRQLSESLSDMADMIDRAARHAEGVDIDPDPSGNVGTTVRELDKFQQAAKNASAAVAELNEVNRVTAENMGRIAQEINAANAAIDAAVTGAKKDETMEALREQARLQKEIAVASRELAESDALDTLAAKWERLGQLGKSALSGIMSGIGDLSLAAFFKKDGDALREFGLSLGKMLVQLGTMAVAYAAVAGLAALFPALIPLVGSPAAAPALAVAGLGAIAAGSVLGAAIPRGGSGAGAAPAGGPGGGSVTNRTTVYNVSLGAGMPARGMSRALLESVGAGVEQGV